MLHAHSVVPLHVGFMHQAAVEFRTAGGSCLLKDSLTLQATNSLHYSSDDPATWSMSTCYVQAIPLLQANSRFSQALLCERNDQRTWAHLDLL